ncbi:MAG: flippase-like domain-containing protein, partial [Chloroflexi bacterium]|nr:flippase-like domain-containing protein [Chloroflexota bacterium]
MTIRVLKWVGAIGGILLGIVLGWWVLRNMDWHAMQLAIAKISWNVWIPALAAIFLSVFLQAIRWKLMLPGESVSTTRLFMVRNAGLSINNLVPGRGIVGEASELAMLT